MPPGITVTLVALVGAAAWSDWRTGRIPNWIPLPAALLGIGLQSWHGGWAGAVQSLTGAGLGLAIFMAFYLLGGMGAGDVKLFGAVGSLVGPQSLVLVFVITGLLGGAAALLLAAARGKLRITLQRTAERMSGLGRLQWKEVRETTLAEEPDSLRLPYGVVIAGGTLLSLPVILIR